MREHRNRPLDELGPQALAIIATALRRAGLIASRRAPFVELLRADARRHAVEAEPVEIRERPPMHHGVRRTEPRSECCG